MPNGLAVHARISLTGSMAAKYEFNALANRNGRYQYYQLKNRLIYDQIQG